MGALQSESNLIPEKRYTIPTEYVGKKLKDEDLVKLGESKSDTIDYIKHYLSYVWDTVKQDKNALNKYNEYFKNKAKSIIQIHNKEYIATVTGKKIDDVSVKFINSQIPQERVLSDTVDKGKEALRIFRTGKLLDLKQQLETSSGHWIDHFVPKKDREEPEFLNKMLSENFDSWLKLNDLNIIKENSGISDLEFINSVKFTLERGGEEKKEIKKMSIGQMNEASAFIKLYQEIPDDETNRLDVAKKLHILNTATKQYAKDPNREGLQSNKEFLLKDSVARSVCNFISVDKPISEAEYSAIANIQGLSQDLQAQGISVGSALIGCKTIAEIKDAMQKLIDQDKNLQAMACQLGLSAEALREKPELSKELAAIVFLYKSYSGTDDTIIKFSNNNKEIELTSYMEKLKADPKTKQYQTIQGVITNYVHLGVNHTDLEGLKEDLLNISPEKFDEEFTKIKENFNLKQYNETIQKWNTNFGPIFGSVLHSQLSMDVEQGTVHYLEQHKTTKTLNDLALFANDWQEAGLQDEFYALIKTSWTESTFSRVYPSILNDNPDLLPGLIDKFGETVFKALTPLNKEDLTKVKEELTKMELEDAYLNRLLPKLFKASDVDISAKLERMKEVAGIYQSAEDAYGKKVADWILQEIDLGATDWKPNNLLKPMEKLRTEFITLSSKQMIEGNFISFVGESAKSSESMADTLKTMQRAINEKFLSAGLFSQKYDISKPMHDALQTMIKEIYPELLSGEDSYLDSDFAKKSLVDQIKQVAPYLPSLQKAGFDEAFVRAYLKNDDKPGVLNARLGDMLIMAAWVNKGEEKSLRENELCKEILLELRSSMVLKNNEFVNAKNFTTLFNTCLNQDPNGIYYPSILARGLAKGLDSDDNASKETDPEKVLAAYIANNQTFLTTGDRFDNKYNAKFAQIYFTVFAEDCAKAVSRNFSEKHQAFLKELLLQTKELPANEAVRNHMKDLISFSIPLFEEGLYKNEDIIFEITKATNRSIETLNKQETIAQFNEDLKLKIISNLDKTINRPSSVLLKTLKTDPFFFAGTFASKLVSGFLKDKDKESIKGFDESLIRLKEPFNQNPFVIKGMSLLIPILDNPYLPLSALMEEGDVKGIFGIINGALKGVKMIQMDENGKLITPTEEAVIQSALFGVLQKASNVIAKTTSLDKQEKVPDEVKTVMTVLTVLVKWKGWITSLIKTWLPAITNLISKIGGGTIAEKLAELALPTIINKVVANMDIDETTKASLKELISKAPAPVINGMLMALPGIIEKIQVDKYLDFLEFITQQYAKEKPDDPMKVQEQLLTITKTLVEDAGNFMPILEETLEAKVEIKQ
jgi:hypothetical protein